MSAQRAMHRGMRAMVWVALCVLLGAAAPRTSWAFAIAAADPASGGGENRRIAAPRPKPNPLAAAARTGSQFLSLAPSSLDGTDRLAWPTDAGGRASSHAATTAIPPRVRRRIRPLAPAGLRLPYEDSSELVEVRCYGVDPWDEATGEIHGGIDLIPRHTDLDPGATRKVGLIAPASGTIVDVRELSKTGKAAAFMLTVKVNAYWFVGMVLEPQNLDPSVADEQRHSIAVQAGQTVRRGDRIGDLVVTNVHYPHVHFMIYYKDPGQTFEDLFAHYLVLPRNQGDNLPPTSGPGSPWAPEDLHIPSTLFCPYVYSEPSSRSRLDQTLKQSHDGTPCTCICAYGSKNADCGVCSQ